MSTCLEYIASLSPKKLGILDNPQRLLQLQQNEVNAQHSLSAAFSEHCPPFLWSRADAM